jgi:lambda family phage tail tape measure protein
VLDEHLVRDAERARTELDTLAQVVSANLARAALEAAPVIADLSSWLADVAGKAGIAWERLFDAPEEKSLRTLRYELDLTETTIAKLQGRIDELRKSPTLGFTTFIDTAQISALQKKIDELSRVRGQTQARIAFLEGPPKEPPAPGQTPLGPDDTAGVKDRAERLQRIQGDLESTLFSITHEGSERIIAEHERRVAEIEALRAKDGSNAEQVDRLIEDSAAVREAQLSQLRTKEAEAAEKVRAANERVVEGLNAERAALTSTERERYVAQALSRLSAEATAQQRREVEDLAGALYDEQQALQARQRLMDEGRSVTDRTRTATEQYAAEVEELDELLAAGAIDQQTYARAVEEANDRALRSSQAWTDGATRFLKDYVAESQDAASATERAFANAFSGAEDALVGFIGTGKLEFQSLADSILADLARTTVRQTITAPLAGALQSAFAGGGLFGLFHEGGIVGERPPAVRYVDRGLFDHAPRYHSGGFAGSDLLPDEVPIIARRGELVVPSERVVARRRRPASNGRSRWWSTSLLLMRAPSAPARARSRPTWRARSIGRAGTGEGHSVPRRHREPPDRGSPGRGRRGRQPGCRPGSRAAADPASPERPRRRRSRTPRARSRPASSRVGLSPSPTAEPRVPLPLSRAAEPAAGRPPPAGNPAAG